jgi:hypothetical protein
MNEKKKQGREKKSQNNTEVWSYPNIKPIKNSVLYNYIYICALLY